MAERSLPDQRMGFEQPTRDTTHLNNVDAPGSEGNKSEQNDRAESLPERRTANRGFAAMDREKQKRIAREGGRAAHKQGVAHEWNKDEAREAGRKGGQIVSQNRDHMSEIGRKGGQNSGQRRQRGEE